jgi:hypothetical protein
LWHAWKRCVYKVLVEKLEGKGVYGRPRNSLQDIKIGIEGLGQLGME